MQLTQDAEPLAYDIAFALVDERPGLRDLESRASVVCRKLRALAVVVLLTRADVARFHANLLAAAEMRRDYLAAAARAPSLAEAGREFAAGRSAGLFDALAAGALVLGREIVSLSPAQWRQDCEYEDDFCWARLVGIVVQDAASTSDEAARLLARFEASLQGQGSARLAVARALLQRDATAFGPAFEALLAEHAQEIDDRVEAGEMDDPVVLAERRVFVEGLAVLALAGACSLPTDHEYLYCPSMGRVSLGRLQSHAAS